ncbi:hypothetical protein CC80DRAFT_591298 [Byssothecium circinans]|uniref:Uncharacterized protein n=1 Tax=Byssothecium circinans TaxID=147558 RepID=A0A6A5U5W2_9PLEO|nr:hypothetical protein CC80DRAFT_591298 [Byssothecium circinans]
MVRFLLEKGVDPNGRYWIPFDSFLMKTASLSSPNIMISLLDHDAAIQGSLVLSSAAEEGRIDSAKILLERGADINEVFDLDLDGDEDDIVGTALHVAVKHDQE